VKRILHKIYGGFCIVGVCSDWPEWFYELLHQPKRQQGRPLSDAVRNAAAYRRNRCDFHMIDEVWGYRKYDYFGYRVQPNDIVVDIGGTIGISPLTSGV
jgi:hypothetical protein